jgi:hypothetical protein
MLLAGLAALAAIGVADVSAATFRSFSVSRTPIARPMVAPKLQKMAVPRTGKIVKPSANLKKFTPKRRLNIVRGNDLGPQVGRPPGGVKPVDPKPGAIGSLNPTGPTGPTRSTGTKPTGPVVGTPTNPNSPTGPSGRTTDGPTTPPAGTSNPNRPTGPVAGTPTNPTTPGSDVGRPPGRNPPNPTNPDGPRPPRPGGPVIGPGVIIGTGVAPVLPIGPIGPAGAAPASPPPPGAFGPPGGPQGPRGPVAGINIPPANENRFVKNEVVLEVAGSFPPAVMTQLLARHRLARLEQQTLALTGTTMLRVRITDGRPVRDVLRGLAAEMQLLRSGQPNYLFTASQAAPSAGGVVPSVAPSGFAPPPQALPTPTPVAAAAAALLTKGDPAQYTLVKLNLAEAHNLTLGSNVVVAVIDSGIDLGHPELAGVVAGSYDALGTAERPHNHGTAVAGAIAARSRLLGVAPAARILAIRAFSATKSSAEATTFAILKGVEYATAQQARVINMSFAGPYDPGLARHLAAAYAKGAVLIAASGNFGAKSPPQYPASDPYVIAVTATDAEDKLFAAANRGEHVAIAAPGVDILLPGAHANYWMASGTSFAAAHVSGIAALILSRQTGLSPDAVRKILLATARDLGDPGRDPLFGAGLADAHRAVLAIEPATIAAPEANAAAR